MLVKFAKKNLNCRELGIFLGVKFGLKILLRVKELTFRNSALAVPALSSKSLRLTHYVGANTLSTG